MRVTWRQCELSLFHFSPGNRPGIDGGGHLTLERVLGKRILKLDGPGAGGRDYKED